MWCWVLGCCLFGSGLGGWGVGHGGPGWGGVIRGGGGGMSRGGGGPAAGHRGRGGGARGMGAADGFRFALPILRGLRGGAGRAWGCERGCRSRPAAATGRVCQSRTWQDRTEG